MNSAVATISGRLRVQIPPSEHGKALAGAVQDALTLPNPEYSKAEKAGRRTYGIPRTLTYWRDTDDGLVLPRGALPVVLGIAREQGTAVQVQDRTRILPAVSFDFAGDLRDYQQRALDEITRWPTAVLSAPTGSGKTVIGLAAIAKRQQPALVICHTATLAQQWVDRAVRFLGIPVAEIGRCWGGKCTIGDRLTIGVIDSVAKHVDELRPRIGHLLADECHRAVGQRFAQTVGHFDCRYVLGLSATPWRRDGKTKAVSWLLGRVHCIDRAPLVQSGAILAAEVRRVETAFTTDRNASDEYVAVVSELTEDSDRNRLIARTAAAELAGDPSAVLLVLSDRRAHCEALRVELAQLGVSAVVLTGELSQIGRDAALSAARSGKVRVIIGTAQLIGEGWDFPAVSTLILATPVRFDGRLLQLVGRILRPAPSKDRARIIDFVDARVPVFLAAARARQRTYEQEVSV